MRQKNRLDIRIQPVTIARGPKMTANGKVRVHPYMQEGFEFDCRKKMSKPGTPLKPAPPNVFGIQN